MTSSETRSTQRSAILNLLISARGDWVSLLQIKREACQYNARLYELRRLGFRITNKIREIDGVRMPWFRLESLPPTFPVKPDGSEPEAVTLQKPTSFPQFGKLAPERYGVD